MTDSSPQNGQPHEALIRLEHENARLQWDLKQMIGSRSWRWTLPLRLTERSLRHVWRRLRRKWGRRKILYIDSRLPLTDRDSGSVRLLEMLRLLAATGADITFIPFDLEDHPEASAALRALGIRVLCKNQINSISAHLQAEGPTYDMVILCRLPLAVQYIGDVETYAPQAKIVFDTVDLHFLRASRQAELADNDAMRAKAAEWKEQELDLMKRTHATVVVSEPEREMIGQIAANVPVFTISNIHHMHVEPSWNTERRSILFLGNFEHEPNVDAARHLALHIMPLVRRELPGAVLEIVGTFPPGTIEDLAAEKVILHGHVPDLAPVFDRARVFAAPLRFGAGVKGKLHMSMSYGVPIVTTSIGAEGMHLTHDKNVIVADEDRAFADGIVRLYRDQNLWESMASSAQTVLREHFSPEVAEKELQRMLAFAEG